MVKLAGGDALNNRTSPPGALREVTGNLDWLWRYATGDGPHSSVRLAPRHGCRDYSGTRRSPRPVPAARTRWSRLRRPTSGSALAELEGTGQVDRVETPDRLRGEGLSSAGENLRRDRHQSPVRHGAIQGGAEARRPLRRDLGQRDSSNEASGTLQNREVGCRDEVGDGERRFSAAALRLAQEPCQHRAGLGVEDQRSPRPSSRSR